MKGGEWDEYDGSEGEALDETLWLDEEDGPQPGRGVDDDLGGESWLRKIRGRRARRRGPA